MRLTTSVTAVLISKPSQSHTSVGRLIKEGKEAISFIFLAPNIRNSDKIQENIDYK